MTVANRPNPIKTILKTLDSGENTDSANLETYITDLEANQLDRPASIVAILKRINSRYSADIGASLEAYIADLEAKQQAVVALDDAKVSTWDPENPPVWSHARAMQRESHSRDRAWRKWKLMNNYR